jgi:hypothetical protein
MTISHGRGSKDSNAKGFGSVLGRVVNLWSGMIRSDTKNVMDDRIIEKENKWTKKRSINGSRLSWKIES